MNRLHKLIAIGVIGGGGGDSTAPTFVIAVVSATSTVASMRITASEQVQNFAVGDITISAGGSLASFATGDNIIFTVDWTLAAGANTMDIAAGVCTDLAGNNNLAATQYAINKTTLQPDGTAGIDTFIQQAVPDTNSGTGATIMVRAVGAGNRASLLKFNYTSIPANSTVLSGVLSLYNAVVTAGTVTGKAHAILAANSAWTEAGATWNYAVASTTRWAGDAAADGGADAGCSVAGTDYNATAMGDIPFGNNDADGTEYAVALNATQLTNMLTNNYGLLLLNGDTTIRQLHSSDSGIAGSRPKIVIVSTTNP